MDINLFVNITSRAWTLSILAKLRAGVAGRQAPLLAATGANRSSFAQSMNYLIEMGLIQRNPGHGHPLRPEFRLTFLGVSAAEFASKLQSIVPNEDQDLMRRSWTLPVLASLRTPRRFNEIKRTLPSITDRALSQSLKTMEDRSWVSRHIDETARPPKSSYIAVNAGGAISQATVAEISFP